MSRAASSLKQEAAIWLAWAHESIGWAGWMGVLILLLGSVVFGWAWKEHHLFLQEARARRSEVPVAADVPTQKSALSVPSVRSPDFADLNHVTSLLTLMEQAAVANGLEWRAADYRITDATASRPASLDVRCSIKGSYPKLRAMLVQVLATVPASTLRELNFSRPTSDSLDVDGKILLSVFLRDDVLVSNAASSKAMK